MLKIETIDRCSPKSRTGQWPSTGVPTVPLPMVGWDWRQQLALDGGSRDQMFIMVRVSQVVLHVLELCAGVGAGELEDSLSTECVLLSKAGLSHMKTG